MALRLWRLLTIMMIAMTAAMTLSSLSGMAGAMALDGSGPASVWQARVVIELGAFLAVCRVALLVRRRRAAFRLTSLAALLIAMAHATWWFWSPLHMPAARTVLDVLALAAFSWSILVDTVSEAEDDWGAEVNAVSWHAERSGEPARPA
ncbi:MAG: hypothetical protein ACM3SS_20045 [Rhodospirillaceae bacterium]